MSRQIKKYGWIPDLPDHRDFKFDSWPTFRETDGVPKLVDLTKKMPPVYDQGELGSCTANAIAGAFEFELLKQGLLDFVPSRLSIYYNERVIEGSVKQDAGAMLRDGMKVINKQGAPHENLWPYTISKFAVKPPKQAYADGLLHLATTYESVPQDLLEMKACLISGYPFVIGFTVYESFESESVAKTGTVPMPKKSESVLGGHAVLVVGYSDSKKRFICRNSWGPDWGKKGYFTMPYNYLINPDLADDFWTIRIVE